jgi:hypothetical protein
LYVAVLAVTPICLSDVRASMADRKITLLELHLDDASFSANATKGVPSLVGDEGSEEADERDDDEEEGTTGGGGRTGTLLGVLLLLVLLAAVARALMGGDEELEELDELDEVEVE